MAGASGGILQSPPVITLVGKTVFHFGNYDDARLISDNSTAGGSAGMMEALLCHPLGQSCNVMELHKKLNSDVQILSRSTCSYLHLQEMDL